MMAVLGIKKACGVLLYNQGEIRKATIYTNSQTALLALSAPRITSSVVNNCRKDLSSLAGLLDLFIIWVSGRNNIFGNGKANELAKYGLFGRIRGGASHMLAGSDQKRALYVFCANSSEQMEIKTKLQDNKTDMA